MELALNPRHTDNSSLADLIADLNGQLGTLLVKPLLDISHSNISTTKRGARQTGGDNADLNEVRWVRDVHDDSALTSRGALLNRQSDATLGDSLRAGELGKDNGSTVEGSSGRIATITANDPAKGRGGRGLRGGDIVAVETHACLETERVTGCQTGESGFAAVGEEELGDLSWE